jgi:predicted ATPase
VISGLELVNFKCFQKQHIQLRNATLLTGLNGAGKSSVIQSMLLLRQSWQQGLLEDSRLALNGELVRLGTAQDAMYSDADEEIIGLALCWANPDDRADWTFRYHRDADVLQGDSSSTPEDPSAPSTAQRPLRRAYPTRPPFRRRGFQYLGAERIGPRIFSETAEHAVREWRQLGSRGEWTGHFLAAYGKEKLQVRSLIRPEASSDDLAIQAEAWLGFVSPGTRLQITQHAELDLVQMQYQFITGRAVSNSYRPTNVGFGLSFTLPVIVATLAAQPGDLILVENPEAHLHPSGQTRIAEMLAAAAAGGVQVVLETHSDHVLNGFRLAVHKGALDPGDLAVHFFLRRMDRDTVTHEITSPSIDRDGRFTEWPEGFFDEWDLAVQALLQPRDD